MEFVRTAIADVVLIHPRVHGDHRGFFLETWHKGKFAAAGLDVDFVQDNHSRSRRGTLRGLHYQIRNPQGKLVRAIAGEVYDVAVDLRRSSPSFGRWVGDYLSAERKNMVWVPPGFAHGFLVVSEIAEVVYKCTDFYAPEHERSLLWNDPALSISWPLEVGLEPALSQKDREGSSLAEAEVFP